MQIPYTAAAAVAILEHIDTLFSVVIMFISAIILLLGILLGFKRGWLRSTVRLATVILSIALSFVIAKTISGNIISSVSGLTLVELYEKITNIIPLPALSEDINALLNEFDPETSGHIIALFVSLFLIPIVFIVLFYVLRLVTYILCLIANAILKPKDKKMTKQSRFIGLAIGAAQALVIIWVLTMPLVGFSSVAKECKPVLLSEELPEDVRESTENVYNTYLGKIISNPVLIISEVFGANAVYDNLTTMTFEGESVSSEEELVTLMMIFEKVEMLKEMDWEYPEEKHKDAVEDIVDLIGDDYYTSTVISGILRGFSRAINDDVISLSLEEPMKSFATSIIRVFEDSSRENLGGDLDTVTHIYFILADHHVIANFYDDDDLRDSLITPHSDGKNVINYVVDELYLNPRTAGIVDTLTEISVKVMCEELNLSEDAKEVYNNVKNDVTSILALNEADFETKEDYREAVSTELKTALTNNNISIDEEIINNMSQFIADNYSEPMEKITDQDINKAILSYYNSYVQQNPDADFPDELPEDLEDMLGKN